jgi:hypothetical protein
MKREAEPCPESNIRAELLFLAKIARMEELP